MPTKAQAAALLASPDEVENQFYEALREADLAKLMAVWAEEEEVICVHPGGPRMVGAAAVRAAFEALFSNGPIVVQPENVRRVHTLSAAVHSVNERLELVTAEGKRTGWVSATNVFIKTTLGWRLVAHHASPGTPHEPVEVIETPAVLH
ncbi:nuclear transport factor 2 family protein [Ideonella azotifigens]|uniref:SnoaL-like domain-containing protein n=1 Tax=Ideonella azotifigens TaxID=513160 RepID=A0ABN1KAV5_9BURK|nr:nuclear transport factor 2 family protein [Ideonella azotifigens]MCD2338752.1 nuclear transport factor 2 family protein [Ideonella azotifigens]